MRTQRCRARKRPAALRTDERARRLPARAACARTRLARAACARTRLARAACARTRLARAACARTRLARVACARTHGFGPPDSTVAEAAHASICRTAARARAPGAAATDN